MEPHGVSAEEPIQRVPDRREGPVISGRKSVLHRLPKMGIDPYYPVQFKNGEPFRSEDGMVTCQATPQFLAIGTSRPMTPEQRDEQMAAEVTATLQLYLDGKSDQFWHRYDGKGGHLRHDDGMAGGGGGVVEGTPLGFGWYPELRADPDRPTSAYCRPVGRG